MNRIKWIDSIRGIACLTVMVAHIAAVHPVYGIYASGCGKIGVWMFFVLSSFLLTLPYCGDKGFAYRDIWKFYIKRIIRIIPCYLIVLCLCVCINYLQDGTIFLRHVFMIEGYGHFWSIPVEVKFYIVTPIFIMLITRKSSRRIKTLILLLVITIFALFFPYSEYSENSISLYWYLPVFLMGSLLAVYYVEWQDCYLEKVMFDVMALLIICVVLISTPTLRYLLLGIQPDRYLQNKYLYFGIGWCLFIFFVAHGKYFKNILEQSKLLSRIGKISFPLYLVHFIVLFYANQYIKSYVLMVIVVSTASIILATLCHYGIEKPCINYLNGQIIKKKKLNVSEECR